MNRIDLIEVENIAGVQTLGKKYLVINFDSSKTKNENIQYILYDMENHKQVGEALTTEMTENENQRITNESLQGCNKIIRVGNCKEIETEKQVLYQLNFDAKKLKLTKSS